MYRDVRAVVYGSSTFARVAVLQILAGQGIEVLASTGEITDVPGEPDAVVVALHSERDIEYLHQIVAAGAGRSVRVAVFGEADTELAHRAAAAGATIVVDHQSADRLIDLIAAGASGHATIPRFVLDRLTSPGLGDAAVGDIELGWLERLDSGVTIAQLAAQVDVPERSVHRRLHDLYARLRVDSCRQALELIRSERSL